MTNNDGDQATTVSVKNPKYFPLFSNLNAEFAFVNRSNGKFNPAMGLSKDYSAICAAGYDHSMAHNQFMMNPEGSYYDVIQKYGLVDPYDNESEELRREVDRQWLEMV